MTIAATVLLAGCGLPIARTQAGLELPASWDTRAAPTAVAVESDWWRAFGSHELSGLIEIARVGSFDVAAAVAQVRQADALARIAGAKLLPEVNATVSSQRDRSGDTTSRAHQGYFAASYEVDLWGANHAARQAALDTLVASAHARDAVLLTLTSDVAALYLQTLASRERAGIARRDLAVGERLLALVEAQFRRGAASALSVAQQQTLVYQLGQTVAERDQEARASVVALATLLGRPPQGFEVVGVSLDGLDSPQVDAGLPAELLVRRPDVAGAERQLAAADADLTVARAAMLPSLTLTALGGASSSQLSRLLSQPYYSVAAGLTAPIFNHGRLAAGRDQATAQRDELLAVYRKAIVSALADVEAALNAVSGTELRQRAQQKVLAQARESLRLAESRYRAGAETLLTLLDAQRTLYEAQDSAVRIKLARLQAAVALYKALGGGWRAPRSSVTVSSLMESDR
ncbi:MAG: efflux transporter outer membrane subunit [Acidovorax sp.]